jgi:hypothetical protein
MRLLFISDIGNINFARKKGSKDKKKRGKRIGFGTAVAGSAVAGGTRGAVLTHLRYRKGFKYVLDHNEENLAKAIKAGNPHAHIIYPSNKRLKQIYLKTLRTKASKGALASATLTGLGYGAYSLVSRNLEKGKKQ